MNISALVQEQQTYFRSGATLPPAQRRKALQALLAELDRRESQLLQALKQDLNKAPFEGYMTELGMIKEELHFHLRHLDGWCKPRRVPTPISQFPARSIRQPEPYGVTLVMAPWNYPLQLSLVPMIGALSAGNCVILKPSAYAPACSQALAELIAGGGTTIADMYMHTTDIAQTVLEAGISANLSCGGVYFGAPADFSPATCKDCDNQRRLTEEWHGAGNGQILVDASIHGEYTSNVPLWQWMAAYAQEKKLGMHVHVSETQSEHEACKKRWGKTPLQILDRYGVWDTRAIAAHCVWTTEEDWALMAEKGVSCIHNPVSNLKLGSGVAWIPAMKRAGVNIALGTDGVSSNNNHDMFEEMKFAAILHNGVTHDPLALLPRQVLAMASRDGARALGRRTGQIVPGYTADLILVDFDRPSLTPCHSVEDNLVYSARGSDVVMNMARGKIIYKDGTFFTLDLERIKAEVETYALPLLFGDGASLADRRN